MTNTPYTKRFDSNGVLLNPITKANPYLHHFKSTATKNYDLKYIAFYHPITGAFMGKVKKGGNNRSWKNGKPRNIKF